MNKGERNGDETEHDEKVEWHEVSAVGKALSLPAELVKTQNMNLPVELVKTQDPNLPVELVNRGVPV